VLLRDAQAALARLQLSQAASTPLDPAHAAWRFDLPVANPSGPGFAQFEISRDGAGHTPGGAAPTWRARFSMDLEPGGPVHAEVSLSGGRTRVTLWAERDGAFRDLAAEQGELVGALAGPEGADAAVRVLFGAPPPPAGPASGQVADGRGLYVDRRS
jgi:hypothetical protein